MSIFVYGATMVISALLGVSFGVLMKALNIQKTFNAGVEYGSKKTVVELGAMGLINMEKAEQMKGKLEDAVRKDTGE